MNHHNLLRTLAFSLVMLVLGMAPAFSQERNTENTLKAAAGSMRPAAKIVNFAWLQGEWVGQGLGSDALEVWSGAAGGAMVGHFRSSGSEGVQFYELMTLVEDKGSVTMRLKHFNADLTGWEEKGKTVDFPLLSLKGSVAFFEGLTYRREGDTLTVYVALPDSSGRPKEEKFVFKRAVHATK